MSDLLNADDEGTWWVCSNQGIFQLQLFKNAGDWTAQGCYIWLENGLVGVNGEVGL